MRLRKNVALLHGALLGLGLLHAESTPSKALLVLAKTDRTLAIVDPESLHVVARMPSGPDPHEVIASADGKFAYISNYGGGAYNTLTVVDLVEQKTLPAIDLGALRGPHGLTFAAGKVWFTAESNKVVGSYDPATKKIDWVLGTGQNQTHMIWVSNDLNRMATSNISSATMTIIEKRQGGRAPTPGRGNPQGDWDETVISVGRGAEGFDVSPDGKELWAANAQDGTISILDLAAKKVVQTLTAEVNGANRLKFTPDGKRVLVSTLGGPNVSIFDAPTRAVVKRIKVGRGAAGIQMRPDGAVAYVACTPDDYVAIIDLKTLEVASYLDAGKQPDGMAWATR
jgi:DNA-binding beta-propeller fold protein YncE